MVSNTGGSAPQSDSQAQSTIAPDDSPPGLLTMARSLWELVCGVAHDQLELLSLEAQMAGKALAYMLLLGAAIGVLLAGTWLCGLLVMGFWLWEKEVSASSIALTALVLNAMAVVALVWGMRRARRSMGFTSSLQALRNPQKASLNSVAAP